jgi:hypothetical protein
MYTVTETERGILVLLLFLSLNFTVEGNSGSQKVCPYIQVWVKMKSVQHVMVSTHGASNRLAL